MAGRANRIRLVGLEFEEATPERGRATVELEWRSQAYTGIAEESTSQAGKLQSAARATTDAVRQILGGAAHDDASEATMKVNPTRLRGKTPPKILASFRAPGFGLFYVHNTFAAVDMSVRMAVHAWLVLELSNDSEFWIGIFALLLGMGQFFSSP